MAPLKLVSCLSFALQLHLALCSWQEVYSDDPRVHCTPRQATGKNACCCYDTACADGGWELPCGGDLDQTCTANQLIGPGGQGDHFTYTEQSVGTCPLPPGCDKTQWLYTWSCCDKPAIGDWRPQHADGPPNKYCPMAAFFIGCSEPNEQLSADGLSCKNTTCSGLATVKSPYLIGNQAVVANKMVLAIQDLIQCAEKSGGETKLNVTSSARCGKSPPPLGTPGISAHQVGMAIDTNLVLSDGTECNRDCMGQGYCAFHQDSESCVNSETCPDCQGQMKTPRNEAVNDFITCAQSISGLKVGATFKKGDWNHFELPVADKNAALASFKPQLKAFCFDSCPGKMKGKKVGSLMCNCDGFHPL